MKKIGIFGVAGSNTHIAATRMVTLNEYQIVWYPSIEMLLGDIRTGVIGCGIAPVHNNSEGGVAKTLKYFLNANKPYKQRKLYSIAEISLPVHHCLATRKGVGLEDITSIESHPQALEQCLSSIEAMPNEIITIPALNTAIAAKELASSDKACLAVICSRFAAELYGLSVIRDRFEDNGENTTSFHLFNRTPNENYERKMKTAVIFKIKNREMCLFSALGMVSLQRRNMTILDMIHLGKKGEIAFYIEFSGSLGQKSTAHIIDSLGDIATSVAVLGSFPIIE